MTAPVRLPVRQGSPEWLAARRGAISSTDISVLLGLSQYKSEAQLADEKAGLVEPDPPSAVMRLGLALEPFVADEYTALTGLRVRRVSHMLRHPSIEWAVASLDREVVGDRRMVEIKTTASRRFADELPQDAESQVRWALGVSGLPRADVAVWTFGSKDPLQVFAVEHDQATFDGLVEIAADFRARLAAGGPFAESPESVRRRYPADDGMEIAADAEMSEAVRSLVDMRNRMKAMKETEEALEVAIQTRMGPASALLGDGWKVTWRRTKDRTETDWKAVSAELLAPLPETDRSAVVGRHATVRDGFRPFRVAWGSKEERS